MRLYKHTMAIYQGIPQATCLIKAVMVTKRKLIFELIGKWWGSFRYYLGSKCFLFYSSLSSSGVTGMLCDMIALLWTSDRKSFKCRFLFMSAKVCLKDWGCCYKNGNAPSVWDLINNLNGCFTFQCWFFKLKLCLGEFFKFFFVIDVTFSRLPGCPGHFSGCRVATDRHSDVDTWCWHFFN